MSREQDWEGIAPPTASRAGRGPDYPQGQCTWYVANEMLKRTGSDVWFFPRPNNLVRDAKIWHTMAGIRILDGPRLGAVVQVTGLNANGRTEIERADFRAHGHVAIVEKIDGRRMYVSQSNWPQALTRSEQWFDLDDGHTYRFLAEASDLAAFLGGKGSPYASVDVVGICDATGITREQCRLLLAICGQESAHGTRYAVPWGSESHNCGGVKYGSWNKQYPYKAPLTMFPDWPTYWREYAAGMKRAYFDKGAQTPEDFAPFYNAGDRRAWIKGVRSIMKDIPLAR